MNCDTCEHHFVHTSKRKRPWPMGLTAWYGCKHGWEKCRKCVACNGCGIKDEAGIIPEPCLVCHGIGRVEKGEKA